MLTPLTLLPPFLSPPALCSLSPSSDPCYLAYPSHTSGTSTIPTTASFSTSSHAPGPASGGGGGSGELLIFDAVSLQAVNIIQAHKSPLSAIGFSSDGR